MCRPASSSPDAFQLLLNHPFPAVSGQTELASRADLTLSLMPLHPAGGDSTSRNSELALSTPSTRTGNCHSSAPISSPRSAPNRGRTRPTDRQTTEEPSAGPETTLRYEVIRYSQAENPSVPAHDDTVPVDLKAIRAAYQGKIHLQRVSTGLIISSIRRMKIT